MLKLVKEEMAFANFFQIRKCRKYCRGITDIIASKGKLFLLPCLMTVGKGKRGAWDPAPRKFFQSSLFHVRKVLF